MPSEDPFVAAAARLNSFAVHLLRAVHRVDAEAGLTPARLSALSVLHFGGPRTLGRLARDEEVTSATMSRLVDALCELGLATRTTHEDNARMVTVSATDAGHALMKVAAARRARVIADALRGLSSEPQQAVLDATPHLAELDQLVRQAVRDRLSR